MKKQRVSGKAEFEEMINLGSWASKLFLVMTIILGLISPLYSIVFLLGFIALRSKVTEALQSYDKRFN